MIPVADRWFETQRIDDDITLLWEPHVIPLMRCNIWHVRGTSRDLMIDTGMGIASLKDAARHLLDKQVTAVATHTHADHIGSHCEFEHCLVHKAEADNLKAPTERGTLLYSDFSREEVVKIHDQLNRDALAFPEPFPYHPHITLAQELPPGRAEEVAAKARAYWRAFPHSRRFPVERLTFVKNIALNKWQDLDAVELQKQRHLLLR